MASVDSIHWRKNDVQRSSNFITRKFSNKLRRLLTDGKKPFQSSSKNGAEIDSWWKSLSQVVTRYSREIALVHAARWGAWAFIGSFTKCEAFRAVWSKQDVGAAITHQHVSPSNQQLVCSWRQTISEEPQSPRNPSTHKTFHVTAKVR